MRDLADRVNPCIRPARTVQLEILAAGDVADDAIDFPLDGPGVLLDLPAAVARAGVFDREFEAGHR